MHLSYLPKSTQELSTRTASRPRGRGSPPDANFYRPLDETSPMEYFGFFLGLFPRRNCSLPRYPLCLRTAIPLGFIRRTRAQSGIMVAASVELLETCYP